MVGGREQERAAASSSVTVTATAARPVVLRLRAEEAPPEEARVNWDPDVVDNENMKKKKSNRCCVYHRPRRYDESSSSSEDSGNEAEFSRRYPDFAGKKVARKKKRECRDPNCKDNKNAAGESMNLEEFSQFVQKS